MSGLFIAFEGLDSAGKKTQIQLLANTLRSMERQVVTISFPSYDTEIGNLIKGWISRSISLSPETASILYAADRMQYQERIKEWLKKDWIVITDRYCYSNIAYQSALGLSKDWLIELEKPIIKPNIVFFLNIPEVTATTRSEKQESLQKFLEMANNQPYEKKWNVIDGTKPVEEIQASIWSAVQKEI